MQWKGETGNSPALLCAVLVGFWEEMSFALVSLVLCVSKRADGATVVCLESYCSLFVSCVEAANPPPWSISCETMKKNKENCYH